MSDVDEVLNDSCLDEHFERLVRRMLKFSRSPSVETLDDLEGALNNYVDRRIEKRIRKLLERWE